MNGATVLIDKGQPGCMSIGALSECVGVPITTLRSWERRYEIPPGRRADGTTRHYTARDAQMLVLMRDDVSRGVRAADAAASICLLFDLENPSASRVRELVAACDRLDTAAVKHSLDSCAAELGLGRCVDEVLFAAMRRIGLSTRAGKGGVHQERGASEAVCRWLRERAATMNLAPSSPLVLLASTDAHNVGLRALALLLRERRFRCGRLPPDESMGRTATLAACRPSAVVMLSHLPAARPKVAARLRAIQERGISVFYAGNTFASPRSRRGVPGRYLGLSVQQAAALIESSVRAALDPDLNGFAC